MAQACKAKRARAGKQARGAKGAKGVQEIGGPGNEEEEALRVGVEEGTGE